MPTPLSLRSSVLCSPAHNPYPTLRTALPTLRFPSAPLIVRSLDTQSNAGTLEQSTSHRYNESVGYAATTSLPSKDRWNVADRSIISFNISAVAVSVSALWLFFSAIPALLAFKKAAESMEKLMDATREELPATMAAIRLSGMEISDLTMELSDLGQEIAQGVRGSTRAVRVAEEKFKQFTTAPTASIQRMDHSRTEVEGGPALAMVARGMKEGIIKGRGMMQMLFTVAKMAKIVISFIANRAKS